MVGIDEVGRGSWAGPLVVGAVLGGRGALGELLSRPTRRGDAPRVGEYYDSKALSPGRRVALVPDILVTALKTSVGRASAKEIDALGMTASLRLATSRALRGLNLIEDGPDVIEVDGSFNFVPEPWRARATTHVKGDTACAAIAAASIIAKVTRDEEMVSLAEEVPYYRFESNKGYPSPEHVRSLHAWGPSVHHRMSWSFAAGLLMSNFYLPFPERGSLRGFTPGR